MKKIVCFGEMLWDMLPSGKMPGGAPMNVAIHLKNFGNEVDMISRIGTDDLGTELLQFANESGLNTQLVQQGQNHLTGVVKVNMDDKSNVQYKILHPVAWDYIVADSQAIEKVKAADAFIFGSLAARSEQSFSTLKELLPFAQKRILDINLRPPHFDKETLQFLLSNTDFLKLNHHELNVLAEYFLPKEGTLEEQTEALANRFGLETICITLGEDGAALYQKGHFYYQKGFEIVVTDTIGAGDSFLAALVSELLKNTPAPAAMQKACAIGALVASRHGATPFISEYELQNFIKTPIKQTLIK